MTGIDVTANLELEIGRLRDRVARAEKTARDAMQPVSYPTEGMVVYATGALNVIRLGGPDQGHVWHVRRISAGGETPVTVAAGRADFFVAAFDIRTASSLGQIGLAQWVDQMTTLPNILSYSRGAQTLRFNEELFVVISNGTNALQYVASCRVEDFQEAALPIVQAE